MKGFARPHLASALVVVAGVIGSGMPATSFAQSVPPSAPPPVATTAAPTVTGVLVARPGGTISVIPPACQRPGAARAATRQNRGLVVCTDAGRLVLLEITPDQGVYARYWGYYPLNRLRVGDHLKAWGRLQDDGQILSPTFAVQDIDLQEAFVDSVDFITHAGYRIALAVLQADPRGPVRGLIHAVPGPEVQVELCGGRPGSWRDLRVGMTVDITHSLFNRRLMTYIRTDRVAVTSCPA